MYETKKIIWNRDKNTNLQNVLKKFEKEPNQIESDNKR